MNAYAAAGGLLAFAHGVWVIAGVYYRPLTAPIELPWIRDKPWWRDLKLVMGGFFVSIGVAAGVAALVR